MSGNLDEIRRKLKALFAVGGVGIVIIAIIAALPVVYFTCRIEVPRAHMAIMTRKTGENIDNYMELAPDDLHKGVQIDVLSEGRHFRNPWTWDWKVVPQVEVPQGKLGVRIRLHGGELGYDHLVATSDADKGIVPDVLRPGRYAINARIVSPRGKIPAREGYAEFIELHDPVVIPAGYKGVVTLLSAPKPDDPNVLLVPEGTRGVVAKALDPGTEYINPYVTRINLVDCRSQRFDLSTGGAMGFPSKDGFWVTLDGSIEFRVKPEDAARVYVTYNDQSNGDRIDEEIIKKVILPNARSFCRLQGSNHSGRDFISGETRILFQEAFQRELRATCEQQGIEIIQALINRIYPPQKIAGPVRDRQIALQQEKQYQRQILQQESEKSLAIEQQMVLRKQALVEADRSVVKVTTEAERRQEVALIEANQRLRVAEFELLAAQDEAAAILARGKAEADVVKFQNEAEAAGWRDAVAAFGGDGDLYARWVLLRKLAPAYRRMMVNTQDSPIMDIFSQFGEEEAGQ
ncbi:MAG: SPFH domain-containing protein [Planctomycetota bacterium]|jgi:regulator of protease activity HflC (stomatin/prohibitin superfamily)